MYIELLGKELRRDEAVRDIVYLDSKGIPTIGVGHNCQASPLPADWVQPLTDAQIDQLLNHDLTVTFAGLDLHLAWWRSLDEVRQRCIANMCFNMGIHTLLEFKNSLRFLQVGEYQHAASNFRQSKWFQQVGNRAVRICDAIETGIMAG